MVLYLLSILFFLAAGVQIFFFLLFLIEFSKKEKSHQTAGIQESVSIIVCAHDEEQNLRELIPILLSQEYSNYEVIVVEDRSNDHSYELLLEEVKKDSRLRVVKIDRTPERMNAKKYALTLGIKAARNDLILLTDADCRPATTQWITAMVSCFDTGIDIVLGYSGYYKSAGFLNAFIRFETLLTGMQYIGLALRGVPYMGVGRNLAYRKSLFLNNKGFNTIIEVTGGDDDLFVNRHARMNNTRVCTGQDALVFSIPKKSWRSFFHQKVRHLSVGRHYKPAHRTMIGTFHLSYVVNWLTGVLLLIMEPGFYWILVVLLLRSAVVMRTTWLAAKKLGEEIEGWPLFFLDFVYVIYYISTGLWALLTKKVKWTN